MNLLVIDCLCVCVFVTFGHCQLEIVCSISRECFSTLTPLVTIFLPCSDVIHRWIFHPPHFWHPIMNAFLIFHTTTTPRERGPEMNGVANGLLSKKYWRGWNFIPFSYSLSLSLITAHARIIIKLLHFSLFLIERIFMPCVCEKKKSPNDFRVLNYIYFAFIHAQSVRTICWGGRERE